MGNITSIISYIKEKIIQPGVRKHTKNIGWMFFARIATMVVTFIATTYIARHLGPKNYGELSYAISFTSIFSFLASLGIDQILYRDLIKYPEKRNEYLGSAISLRVLASIVTSAICVGAAFLFSSKDVSLLLIFIISLTYFFSSFQLLSTEFQADSNSKYPSIFSFFVVLILNILKITVVVFDKGVIYLAGIILLEPILYSIAYFYLRTKFYGTINKLKFNKTIAISILKDSFPLIFASAFYVIYARIDQVMIKYMLDATSVGLYDAAVRISELSYFVPNIIVAALFPAIINAKKSSDELYYKRLKKLLYSLAIMSTLIAIVTTFLSRELILIIFGAKFIEALPVLRIYVWSNIGAALNLFVQQVLVAENLTKHISVTTFCGMIVNVVLNIYLIPKYGMVGAAFASFISYLVPFLSLLLLRRARLIVFNILKS